jgi:hypothetical protein
MIQRWEAAYPTGAGANLVDELCAALGTPTRPCCAASWRWRWWKPDARAILRCHAHGPKDFRWLYTQC